MIEQDHHIDKKEGHIKKSGRRRRYKLGEKALREIRFFQQKEGNLIPFALVRRGVRHALRKEKPMGVRIEQKALERLHTALEAHIVRIFRSAMMMAIHANRVTVMPKDMKALFKVCDSMEGKEDLSDEPFNPQMSEAHKKKKKETVKISNEEEKVKKIRRKHRHKQKEIIEHQPQAQTVLVEEEEENVLENILEMETEMKQTQEDGEDWCLDEEY